MLVPDCNLLPNLMTVAWMIASDMPAEFSASCLVVNKKGDDSSVYYFAFKALVSLHVFFFSTRHLTDIKEKLRLLHVSLVHLLCLVFFCLPPTSCSCLTADPETSEEEGMILHFSLDQKHYQACITIHYVKLMPSVLYESSVPLSSDHTLLRVLIFISTRTTTQILFTFFFLFFLSSFTYFLI